MLKFIKLKIYVTFLYFYLQCKIFAVPLQYQTKTNSINHLKKITTMKKNLLNQVENKKAANAIVTKSKKQLKGYISSPFAGANILNKGYKGDFSKLSEYGVNCEDFIFVGKILLQHQKENANLFASTRYPFNLDLFQKDSKGRFCYEFKSKKVPIWGTDIVNVSPKGYIYLKPIKNNITDLYNAFTIIAKNVMYCAIDTRKLEEKEHKAEIKSKETLKRAKSVIFEIFGENSKTFTDAEILEKYNKIKATK